MQGSDCEILRRVYPRSPLIELIFRYLKKLRYKEQA